MSLLALLIVNRSGGLIYQRDFALGQTRSLSTNELLILAGSFHGVHALAAQLSPLPPPTSNSTATTPHGTAAPSPTAAGDPTRGLQLIQTATFNVYCHQTLSGIKFIFIVSPTFASYASLSAKCHQHYVDFVMKNPFYQPEMPIRVDLFDQAITRLAKTIR